MPKALQFLSPQKVRQGLVLFFFWAVLPLFLVEFLMIVLEPYLSQGIYQYDRDLGFRIRPYANGNNQFGFNDRDYPLQKEPGKFRIVVVSDSFNWAGGRERNYTTLLEKQFEHHYQIPQVDVINTGYPGTHTGEQLAMLKKYGLQYKPDLVVLGFFVGNDFLDGDPNRKRIIVNDVYVDIDRRRELVVFGYPIIGQSRLLLFIQQKYKVFQEAAKSKQSKIPNLRFDDILVASSTPQVPLKIHTGMEQNSAQPPEQSPGIMSLRTFLKVEKTRLKFCDREDLAEGKWDENIDYVLSQISEMNHLLKERDIEFIVAIYPDEIQVNPQLFQQVANEFDLDPKDYELTCMQRILTQHLDSEGIQFINLLERFQHEQKQQPLYLLQEPHWNSAGNQLAASILFEHLVKTTNRFLN
ncbi:MAG: alginate O-acetyltransferase AlgX-related protein [Microcoleaceae cyanobacterium]